MKGEHGDGIHQSVANAIAERTPIEIGAERVAAIRAGWVRRVGAVPTPNELDALLRDAVDDEILFREALAAGLLQVVSVVRWRMVQNARFLGIESSPRQTHSPNAERPRVSVFTPNDYYPECCFAKSSIACSNSPAFADRERTSLACASASCWLKFFAPR